jgi:hypothetical protein
MTTMPTAAAPAAPQAPAGEMTPQCTVGQLYEDDWPDGHPACRAPGYQHEVLGWIDIPCACPHHTEAAEA